MRKIAFVMWLVFSALNAASVFGQDDDTYAILRNSSYRTVTPSSISSYNVYAMAQDDRGMLWFGTNNGLFYFDNYNFVNFGFENEKNAQITSLLCVGDNVFVGTESGLSIVNLNGKTYTNLLNDKKINTMRTSFHNVVYIGTDVGLYEFEICSGTVNQIGNVPININDIEDNSKTTWIATDNGLFSTKGEDLVNTIDSIKVKCICAFDDERLYVGTNCGMYLFENEKDTLSILPFDNGAVGILNPDISDITALNDDEIIVGTNGNGIFRYNVENHEVINITRYGTVSSSLSDDYIIKLFKDDADRVWIATALGINKMVKEFEYFTSFSLYNGSTHNIPVRSIAQIADNELFVGTDYGIFVFNKTKNSYTGFEDYYHLDNHRIESTRISKVYYGRNRYLWIGTRYKGIFCFDTKNKKFIDWLPDFSHQIINDIVDDKQGGIWIASDKSLSRVDIKNRTCERVYSGGSRGILYDGDILYVTTDCGLMRRDLKNGEVEIFEVEGNNILYNITKGPDGNIYLGSYLDGVLVFDVKTHKFNELVNDKDGLSPIAYTVLFDKDDNIWVSTNIGICRYDKVKKTISTYNSTDGLQGNDFTMNGAMCDDSGLMYFGGFNGFSVFNPLIIKSEKTVPKIIVSKVHTASGNDLLTIHSNDTLWLKSDENTFSVNFSAYNLNKINKIRYNYILNGYDRQWSEVGSENHQAEYRNIPAGTYTFLLTAANEANVKSQPFQLTFVVKPKWNDTIYFKIGVFLFVLLLILLCVYLIIRRVHRKIAHAREINELERKMFILKGKALQMQMNPHFLYNTLNSIQSFIIANDSLKASLYLSSFAKLMRKILNNATRECISLAEELELIRLYLDLEMLRLNGRFVYTINIDHRINVSKVKIASMLLQPFAENAVIHGLAYKAEGGILKIDVKPLNQNEILFVIEDNGIGRVRAAQIRKDLGKTEKSHATSITKQRLEILNEVSRGEYSVSITDLYDEHEVACGTRVEIKMCCHD